MKKRLCLTLIVAIHLMVQAHEAPVVLHTPEPPQHITELVNLNEIIRNREGKQIKYRDYTYYVDMVKNAKGIKEKQRLRKKFLNDPNFILSYIVFYLYEIVNLQNKYDVGTVSLTLGQSFTESHFGLSDLGLKGNHFGIKGSFSDVDKSSSTTRQYDDGKGKSVFGTCSTGYGYASLVKYFRVLKKVFNRSSGDTYKHWAMALQTPYHLCSSCKGYGCRSCKHFGLSNCTVYATTKVTGRKPYPPKYAETVINTIDKYNWSQLDGLSAQDAQRFIKYIKHTYTY
ncbi:MAG: glucosaminidase domain-containing protein [Acinetobacter sp.]|nr:glucosaminidase domain-containing protein [Acinetobacter sp.]